MFDRICLPGLNCLIRPLFSASASLSLYRAKRPTVLVIFCASEQSILFRRGWVVMSCLLMGETFSTCIPCLGTLSASDLTRRERSCGFISAELQDTGAHTQLTVTRHPFIPTGKTEIATLDNQTLTRYL